MANASLLERVDAYAMALSSSHPLPIILVDLWRDYDPRKATPLWKILREKHASSSGSSSSSSLWQAIVFTVGILVVTLLYALKLYHQQQRQQQKDADCPLKKKPKIQRSVSFTSSMIAAKVLPERVNFPDSVINIYIEFQEGACPSNAEVVDCLVHKLLQYERLRMLPVVDPNDGHLSFQPISFDAHKLVRRIAIDTSEKDTMYSTIQDHIHDPLEDIPGRGALPWWEVLVIENKGTGNSACLWRIHHALGDGISLATVAQQTLEYADGTPFTSVIPPKMMEKTTNKTSSNNNKLPWYSLAWKLWMATYQVFAMPWTHPDHDTLFSKGMQEDMVHTRKREIVLLPTLPLEFVKAVKDAAKVTINDVLFTCLSQAIRDYLEELKCPVLQEQGANLLCRALIAAVLPRPVSHSTAETLQNKWFLLSSDLGVGVSPKDNDILERLQYLHQHLASLKTSPVPIVGLALQNFLMPHMPRQFNARVNMNVMARRSVSISNVPGPGKMCLFANQPVVGVNMFLSNILPHVAFISYAGEIFGNITLDPEAIPNAHALSQHFEKAIVKLATKLKVQIPKDLQR